MKTTTTDASERVVNIGESMLRMLVCTVALLLGGCASITGSKMQPISLQTTQGSQIVSGADCTLSNDIGKWSVRTPGSVTVQKSTADLTIECSHDNVRGTDHVSSKANTNVWGNILIGGLIGYAIDRSSGAGFDYPDSVTIKLVMPGPNAPSSPQPSVAIPPVTDGRWRAVMACDTNRFISNSKPYQANFQADVTGGKVTLQRKNKLGEEVLTGIVQGDQLSLDGMGYRFLQPDRRWVFKFSGQFTGNSKIYSGKGDMLVRGGQSARTCTLVMIQTDVPPPPPPASSPDMVEEH